MRPFAFVLVAALVGCASDRSSQQTRYPSPQPGYAQPPPGPAPPSAVAPPPGPVAGPNEERFTGKITEIHFGCAVDASCNLVVDGNKYVHFGHDTRGEAPSEWGNAESLWPLMNAPNSGVGRTVDVYAASEGEGSYTIQGKKEYYVRVLEP
jgi:hypothetical protein